MTGLPDRKFVKVTLGGVSHTVPVDDLSYYKRAGYLEEGEKPDESLMSPAEKRMAEIARGEQPDNQVSSVNLRNVNVPASASEIAATVIYGSPGGPNVPGPAASDEAVEDAEEDAEEDAVVEPAAKSTKKKGGK